MAKAFRCDDCGQFCDGAPAEPLVMVVNEFEVKVTVTKRKPAISSVIVDETDDDDDDDPVGTSWLNGVQWFAPYMETKSADLCQHCIVTLARTAVHNIDSPILTGGLA